MRLIDLRTDDGSRHFLSLPKQVEWQAVCNHIAELQGVTSADVKKPEVGDAHLEFAYRHHDFRVTGDDHHFHFFVRDPQCSDVCLYHIASHCETLLAKR